MCIYIYTNGMAESIFIPSLAFIQITVLSERILVLLTPCMYMYVYVCMYIYIYIIKLHD